MNTVPLTSPVNKSSEYHMNSEVLEVNFTININKDLFRFEGLTRLNIYFYTYVHRQVCVFKNRHKG